MEKFPIVIQHDAMQCGIACMQMVCKFYGREYSQEYLSELCHATVEGVSLLAINETMGSLGFHTVCARAAVETLEKVPLPCILHWNQNHFVVLYEVRKGYKFHIADPGKGLITYNREEFVSHWISTQSDGEEKGIAMFLEPTPAFYSRKDSEEERKDKNPRSFRFLFGYVKKYKQESTLKSPYLQRANFFCRISF